MPDFSHLLSKTFRKEDVIPGSKTLTIKEVAQETVGQGDNSEEKPVAYFEEDPRGLVLNQTKYNILSDAFGSRDTDKWIGKRITLFYDKDVMLRGKRVGAIAVEAAA